MAALPHAMLLRIAVCMTGLSLLAACASHRVQISGTQEAAQYASRARRDYPAPGPASDPWGPYISEAALKYDVPESWIREVIHQESGGRLYEDGQLITSDKGAMGLMQVMPATYDELRVRYELGGDPYDPHDNIMAGTAYIRELYDAYGSPGFLAAYNAGPGRLDDYLYRRRPLPNETRRYVAHIAPAIAGVYPQHQSSATQYAMLQLPAKIPPGPRNPRKRREEAPVALASSAGNRSGMQRPEIQLASLPEPPAPPPQPQPLSGSGRRSRGFHLIAPAVAETLPSRGGGSVSGTWAIQVGAFGTEHQARAATVQARSHARDLLAAAQPSVGPVRLPRGVLYRARFTGLSRNAAVQACERLGRCIVVSPDAQS